MDRGPYRPRTLADTLRRAARTFPSILVTGPRQSGKTTLLRTEFEDSHEYVSVERPDVRERAQSDPIAFLDEHPSPVILDEIQYTPELLSYIKSRIDADRRPARFIFSGSQSFAVMKGISESLAGRIAVTTLHPFSVDEAGDAPNRGTLDELLDAVFEPVGRPPGSAGGPPVTDWLLRGGFPELRANPDVDRKLWFAGYVQTYLQRDVRDLLNVGDLDTFNRFVGCLAARNGALLNMTDLGRDLAVSGPTVRRWISVLEASHLLFLVGPYHRNFGKRLTKSPKPYFLDPGLLTFLLGIHAEEPLLHGPTIGSIFEAAVLGEWVKAFAHRGEPPSIHFWRSTGGHEVDFVIERNQRLYAIEVKATRTPLSRHADGLRRWLELAGPQARGVLACNVDAPVSLGGGVHAVPWHLGWVWPRDRS